jgi:hypothetical protein
VTLLESLLLGRCPDSVAAFTERPDPKTPRERLQHMFRRNDHAMRQTLGEYVSKMPPIFRTSEGGNAP